ncbi:MAG: ATP-binding cassette domain-containing protein [Microbacteriaceae bacterium]
MSGAAALAARGVEAGYPGKPPLLAHWSADFFAGETVAIVGPSGAGKSTVLYTLGLMLRPLAGEVRVHGEPASARPDAQRSRLRATTYGFVFQDAVLDPTRNVLDNVTEASLYRGEDGHELRDRAVELLERFDVSVQAASRPGQISGGQAQRIALCRALLHRPSIVLADEPTGNLDDGSARVVIAALRAEASRGAAVIVVTHDSALARECDRKIEL